jgi:hypothetical protein
MYAHRLWFKESTATVAVRPIRLATARSSSVRWQAPRASAGPVLASRLFALDGAEVVEVDEEPGGGRTLWVVTADPGARVCQGCQTLPEHVREQVVTRPAAIG